MNIPDVHFDDAFLHTLVALDSSLHDKISLVKACTLLFKQLDLKIAFLSFSHVHDACVCISARYIHDLGHTLTKYKLLCGLLTTCC